MAYIPRSSFTPTNASVAIPAQVKKRRTIRVFGLISAFMIVSAVLGTVFVFLYAEFSLNQLETAKIALQKESDVDNEKYIEEIRLYDKKLRIANYLLDTHITPSNLFEKLESSIKQTVQFEKLEFSYDPGFEATLAIEGVTKEFASLALQEIQLDSDGIFSKYVLHDIALVADSAIESDSEGQEPNDSEEKVTFKITGVFEKDLLIYTGDEINTLPVENNSSETGNVSSNIEGKMINSTASTSDELDLDSIETTQI